MLSKIAAPLLRLVNMSREVERVALAYLLVVARSYPVCVSIDLSTKS